MSAGMCFGLPERGQQSSNRRLMPRRKHTDGDPSLSTGPTEIEALITHLKQSDLPEPDALLVERL